MRAEETTGGAFPAGQDQQRITGGRWRRGTRLAFGGFHGRSKKALILRSTFCELFYSNIVVRRSATPITTPQRRATF